ncbi:Beta-galactosidase [Dirofilaria immitis]
MYQEWSHASESSRGVSTLVCTFSLFEFYRKLEFCGQHNFAFVYGACACCLCFCIAKSILGCIALILVSTNFVLHYFDKKIYALVKEPETRRTKTRPEFNPDRLFYI